MVSFLPCIVEEYSCIIWENQERYLLLTFYLTPQNIPVYTCYGQAKHRPGSCYILTGLISWISKPMKTWFYNSEKSRSVKK